MNTYAMHLFQFLFYFNKFKKVFDNSVFALSLVVWSVD